MTLGLLTRKTPQTANKNTSGRSDRERYQNPEREMNLVDQRSWPSACDGVAENRRPSA